MHQLWKIEVKRGLRSSQATCFGYEQHGIVTDIIDVRQPQISFINGYLILQDNSRFTEVFFLVSHNSRVVLVVLCKLFWARHRIWSLRDKVWNVNRTT